MFELRSPRVSKLSRLPERDGALQLTCKVQVVEWSNARDCSLLGKNISTARALAGWKYLLRAHFGGFYRGKKR